MVIGSKNKKEKSREDREDREHREERISSSRTERIENYLYLVEDISGQFNDISPSQEDLQEAGYIGLLNAVNLYDQNIHQMNFKTYAQILITEEIHQYLLNHNRQVDRPDWLIALNQKIDQFVISYRKEHQGFPRISEIAAHLNIDSSGLQEVLKSRDSLRENFSSCDINRRMQWAQIEPQLRKIKSQSYQSFKLPIEDLIILRKAFKKLKNLQEGIVYYLFMMDLSQTKLGKALGLSPGKLSKMKKEAYHNLFT